MWARSALGLSPTGRPGDGRSRESLLMIEPHSFELPRSLADQIFGESRERRIAVVAHEVRVAKRVGRRRRVGDQVIRARSNFLSAVKPRDQLMIGHAARL